MRLPLFALALGSVLVLSASAQAISRRHDVADSQYLNLGAAGPALSVGRAHNGSTTASACYIGFGNGFHWALTAGHVSSIPVTTFAINGMNLTITQRITMSGYNSSTLHNDLGLLRLSANPGVAALPYSDQGTYLGWDAMYVGFGFNGTGQTGANNFDGLRRAAMNTIDEHTSPDFWRTTFQTPTQSGVLPMEGTTAGGDSGGAMLVNDGGWRLIGVVSWGTSSNSLYGDLAYNTTLHNRVSFIQSNTGIAPVPEPASMIALGLGAVALVRRRRTR